MAENSNQDDNSVLPRCFMDVAIDGQPAGRIVVELFSNVCPKTCENFRSLCTGEKSTSQHPLHYKGSPFHRIVKNFMIQGGDFINGNGTGGESIYGHIFPDENFTLKHDRDFLVSMANRGPNSNGSQFFILTKPAPHLDGIHVVFGRVVNAEGKKIVKAVEAEKVDENYRPFRNVTITNCGELVLLKKPKSDKRKKQESESAKSSRSSSASSLKSDSESSKSESSEDEAEKKKRRKKDKKVKEKRSKKSKKSKHRKSSQSSDAEKEPDDYVCSVRADEIPPVPSQKFLQRCSQAAVETALPQQSLAGPPPLPPVRNNIAPNARVVKGRGSFRYNPGRSSSPEDDDYDRHDRRGGRRDRSRSRSNDRDFGRMRRGRGRDDEDDEPAHWRQASQRSVPYEVYKQRVKGRQEREEAVAEREKKLAEQRRREEKQKLQRELEELEERERQLRRGKNKQPKHRSRSSSRSSKSESNESDSNSRGHKKEDYDDRRRPTAAKSDSRSSSDESSRSNHGHRRASHHRKSSSPPAARSNRNRSKSADTESGTEQRKHNRSRDRSSSSNSSSASSEKSKSRSRSRDRSWRR